jgi:hypothetical protein
VCLCVCLSVSLLVCLFVHMYFKKKLYILLVSASLLRFSYAKTIIRITTVSKHLKNATNKILYLVTLLESLLGNSPNQEENLSRFQPN